MLPLFDTSQGTFLNWPVPLISYNRYIGANTECSTAYKRCNKQIPDFLHNRPNYLVEHCMKRLVYAAEAKITAVNKTSGIFTVRSESNEGAYNVFSSSPGDESIPSCECLDWQRNYLPCKHMLAVIMSADGWSWEDLPVEYQESPYLTLDKEVLFQNVKDMELPTLVQDQELYNSYNMPPRPNTGVEGAHNSCSMTETPCSNKDSMSAPTSTSEIPKKIYPKRTLVTRCCDLLAKIKNLVHETTCATGLSKLEQTLQSAFCDLEAKSENVSGIILSSGITVKTSTKRKKNKNPNTARKKAKLSLEHKLPLNKVKKKHPYNSRVGAKAQMMKNCFKTPMSLEEMRRFPSAGHSRSADNSNKDTEITKLTSFANFTPTIKKGKLRETLLKNGPHGVSLLQLKSLEPHLPRGTEIMLKGVCKDFKQGWLFDEVVNSFFWCLQESNSHILYAPSTSMLVLQKNAPCGRLWKDEDVTLKKFIVAPWNPTNYHWTLVAVDLQLRKVLYLDPLQNVNVDNRFVQLLSVFMPQILNTKFGLSGFAIESPPHTLQTDLKSCGVLVCWYALQLINGRPLTSACNENAMRHSIYNTIRGGCLKRRSGLHIELEKCPMCTRLVQNEGTKCTRCLQLYHWECTSSDSKPNTTVEYYCPPI